MIARIYWAQLRMEGTPIAARPPSHREDEVVGRERQIDDWQIHLNRLKGSPLRHVFGWNRELLFDHNPTKRSQNTRIEAIYAIYYVFT